MASCPACGAAGCTTFYEAPEVPAATCVLHSDQVAARSAPRGAIALAFCPRCGFVFNHRFRPELVDYGQDYEGSQRFSPRFARYLDELVRTLRQRVELRGRRVVEVGCGSGEFLVALCGAAGCTGVGVDPAWAPARAAARAGDVRFLAEPYEDRHAKLAADVVVCRMTLEHIAGVAGFLALLRRTLGDGPHRRLVVQVPDAARILRRGLFCDVLHEHCSYFTPGSLRNALATSGFGVVWERRLFAGQHLTVVARPVTPTPPEPPSAATGRTVERFPRSVGRAEARLLGRLAGRRGTRPRAVLWGSGSKAAALLSRLPAAAWPAAVVDVSPHRQGTFMPVSALPIVPPEALVGLGPRRVVVMNPVYFEEIVAALTGLGLAAGVPEEQRRAATAGEPLVLDVRRRRGR